MKKVTFQYSRISSLLFTILPLGIILMSVPNLIKFIKTHDTTNWLLILSFDFFFLLLLVYIIFKQLVPALQGKIALEINQDGIISYVRNFDISWEDVQRIELKTGKSSSSLYITFKYETDHGRNLRISLGFVDGNESQIYDTVITYFEKSKLS